MYSVRNAFLPFSSGLGLRNFEFFIFYIILSTFGLPVGGIGEAIGDGFVILFAGLFGENGALACTLGTAKLPLGEALPAPTCCFPPLAAPAACLPPGAYLAPELDLAPPMFGIPTIPLLPELALPAYIEALNEMVPPISFVLWKSTVLFWPAGQFSVWEFLPPFESTMVKCVSLSN